ATISAESRQTIRAFLRGPRGPYSLIIGLSGTAGPTIRQNASPRYPIGMHDQYRSRPHPYLLAGLVVIPLTALIEFVMHRLPISQSHRILLWARITSPELSQQIADAYSFSHLIHGLAFYAIFRFITKRTGHFSLPLCFFLAMVSECGWE